MTHWVPSEEDSGMMYLIAAGVCWSSQLWFDLFYSAVVSPLFQWSQFGSLIL
ncbi:MAG: hypothetical protein OSA38_01660 [Candidatus Poseidoniaceae archaeon]|nr:hypothetical protein [Candidatus Poseidoniaceae archaeon]